MEPLMNLLRQLVALALTKRGGVVALLVAAAAAIGGGVVPHDSPEGQAAGTAAGAVAVLGLIALGAKLLAKLAEKNGGPPPAAPGGAALAGGAA